MYSVSVSFNAAALDKKRLERFLRKEFEAADIRIISESDQPINISQRSTETTDEIIALAKAKQVFRWREVASLVGSRSSLERLLAANVLKKVQHGVFALADAENVERLTASLGPYQSKLGSRQAAILELLQEPRTAPELQAGSGVSRQAVNQLLQKLVSKGLIRRIPAVGEGVEWLYVQTGARLEAALLRRAPNLSRIEEEILNLLPPSGSVLLRDLRERVPGCFGPLKRLVLKRLLGMKTLGHAKLIHITEEGIRHSQYRGEQSPFPQFSVDMLVPPDRLSILLALAALGTARALDVTAVAQIEPKNGTGTGQLLGLLKRARLVQQGKEKGKAPLWSLTAKGSAIVAEAKRNGKEISAEDAAEAVQRANQQRVRDAVSRSTSKPSGRTVELLRALDDSGPARPNQLQRSLSTPFENRRSIYLALRSLRLRGWANTNGADDPRKRVWQLTPAGQDLLTTLQKDP